MRKLRVNRILGSVVRVWPVLPIALLVLVQGGFFDLVVCALGVPLSVVAAVLWLRAPRRGLGVPLVPLALTGLALAYALSALANGTSLTTLGEAGCWAACAAFSFAVAAQDEDARRSTIAALGCVGVVTAVAGVLVAARILSLPDGMVEERLQFSFQYANAAAAWYGVCALLCLLGDDKRLRSFAALPVAALLLTESGGALLVFTAVAAVLGVRAARAGAWEALFDALVQAVLAGVVFVAVHVIGGLGALLALVAVGFVCYRIGMGWKVPTGALGARTVSLALAAACVLAALVGCVLLGERVAQATASLAERACHIRDGIALWSSKPLLGVGPNNWQYLYQYIQTAHYNTVVVHSSLVQFLVDAGLLGLVAFVTACVFGLKALACPQQGGTTPLQEAPLRDGVQLWAAAFLLAHSAIEFDLQFGSLAFVLAMLLTASDEAAPSSRRPMRIKGVVAGVACIALLLPSCALGFVCATWSAATLAAIDSGDYAAAERLFESNPFAQADVETKCEYLKALFNQGRYDEVEEAYAHIPAPSDEAAAYAAIACYQRGRVAEATTVLVERLEAQQFNAEFCETAKQLANTYGVEPSLHGRFGVAVERVRTNVRTTQ